MRCEIARYKLMEAVKKFRLRKATGAGRRRGFAVHSGVAASRVQTATQWPPKPLLRPRI